MKWVEFVKSYCSRHGISYKEALKNADCKEQYHKQKGEQKAVEKGNKQFKEHQENKHLIIAGTPTITVPEKMLLITDKGEEKVIDPLTKSGNVTRKYKKTVINLKHNDKNTFDLNIGRSHKEQARFIDNERDRKWNKAYPDNKHYPSEIDHNAKLIKDILKRPKITAATKQKLEELKEHRRELIKDYEKDYEKMYMYAGHGQKDDIIEGSQRPQYTLKGDKYI
jgi:hypothetical protein